MTASLVVASSSATPSQTLYRTLDPQKQVLDGNILDQMITTQQQKGRNVSGRSWKMRPQKRASTLIKTKTNNLATDWDKKQIAKLAKREAKDLQETLKEERQKELALKKERRLENEKRRAENELKVMQKSDWHAGCLISFLHIHL
jgi:hypothetical protein